MGPTEALVQIAPRRRMQKSEEALGMKSSESTRTLGGGRLPKCSGFCARSRGV